MTCQIADVARRCYYMAMDETRKLNGDRDGFSGFNALNERLARLDERGLVLSLSAFAEDSLGELLRTFLRQNSAANQLLDGFNAPLGTLSARIKAAHALGLLTDDQFSDLENLRKIRNEFSHTWEEVSLEKQHIRDRIHKLSYSSIDDKYPETLSDQIRTSISAVLIELRVVIDKIGNSGLRLGLIGTRLIAGLSGSIEEQLRAAEIDLATLKQNLTSARGREKGFYQMMRHRWIARLEIAAAGAPVEHRAKFAEIISSLRAEMNEEAASPI